MSKKHALIVGLLAIGGIAAASAVASGDTSSGGVTQGKVGGILGTYGGASPGAPITYQIPPQADVSFPDPVDYTEFFKTFLAAKDEPVSRGEAGVSAAPKKVPVYSSLGYAETTGFKDLPSITAHLPASEIEGYVKPKQKTYGTGYKDPVKAPVTDTGKKYSFWDHLFASLQGKEEAYTSRYDYAKGMGMIPKVTVTKKEEVTKTTAPSVSTPITSLGRSLAPVTTVTKKTVGEGLSYGSRSHTVSKTGMHTVTSVSKTGRVSKSAYRN